MRPSKRLLIMLAGWLATAAITASCAMFQPIFPGIESWITGLETFWFYSGVLIGLVALFDLLSILNVRDLEILRLADRVVQQLLELTVGTERRRDDARLVASLQHDGARAVAEQHRGRAVFPVRQPR